jgi:RNA polymerase sigma-32 factor
MSINNMPISVGDSGLAAYMQQIKNFPMLERDQEFMLAKKLAEHDDTDAAHQLVTSHLRLVAKIAMGYRFYGLAVSDLISEGNIGLMRAVKKFDPDKGFRLSTYAMWWIKAAISEYVLNSWSLVKIGTVAAQKKLFFNLRRLKSKLNIYDDKGLSMEDTNRIAATLDVDSGVVADMNGRLSASDSSLNSRVGDDGDLEHLDLLVSDAASQEDALADREERTIGQRLIKEGLSALDERETLIIKERHLTDPSKTLEELGRHFGVSRERVRQVESRALSKLKNAIKDNLSQLNSRSIEPTSLINYGFK